MSEKLKNILVICMTGVFLFGFAAWSVLKPVDKESVSERRALAGFPEIGYKSVLTGEFMTDFEKYTLDQFPLRDQFRTVKAVTAFYFLNQKDNNDIYIKDGYASKLEYPVNLDSLGYAAKRFQFVYDKYIAGSGGKVYLSVIPDKNYFMAEANGYPSMDYETLISQIKQRTEFAEYIDISHLLELSDYYATDTHWRQEEILDVAEYIAERMDVELAAEYEKKEVELPFFGVYYGQSALPLPADKLYYLENDILRECTVYDYETNAESSVYDLEKLKGDDLYEIFLSGSKSLLTVENPKASTDKELILFRDSFGSSIAPLLVEAYEKITLVDIRYISPNILERFIEFENQDILFLYSSSVLNNSITIK